MVGQNLVTATIDGTSTKVWLGGVSRNICSGATAPTVLYHDVSMGQSDFSMTEHFDIPLARECVENNRSKLDELKKLAKEANRKHGEFRGNFSLVWIPGGEPVFRFFSEAAAAQFERKAPKGCLRSD
jgi:hypothetical protein